MLSVVIEAQDDEEALARTLASLVGAAVEGVVREAIVYGPGWTDGTRIVAEHAGCRLVSDLPGAIRQARSEWLLLLEPGARLGDGWTEAVAAHCSGSTAPARFSQPRRRLGFLVRHLIAPRPALASGLLISKEQARSATAGDGEALARGVAATRLRAEIYAANG